MDISGFQWTLMTVIGVIALGGIIAFAVLRNRSSRREIERSEEATDRVYEEEEREHHGEADKVP